MSCQDKTKHLNEINQTNTSPEVALPLPIKPPFQKNQVFWADQEKIAFFEKTLVEIKDPAVRAFTEKAVTLMPSYFFEVPASSTGKYHPTYQLGQGGLARHVQATLIAARYFFEMEPNFYTQKEKDLLLSSLILHDGWKSGSEEDQQQYTQAKHPLLAKENLSSNAELLSLLPDEDREQIFANIASHMGRWNTDYRTGAEILPLPQTKTQKFVHLMDYLASRKSINFDFNPQPAKKSDFQSQEQHLTLVEKEKMVQTFAKEIGYLQDQNLAAFVKKAMLTFPCYFWTAPADFGHSDYLSSGGLQKKVRAAVVIAKEYFRMSPAAYTLAEQDLILASLLLGHGWHYGTEKKQQAQSELTSNLLACQSIKRGELGKMLPENMLQNLTQNIAGVLNPQSKTQRTIRMVDYLASRPQIKIDFDAPLSNG